MALRILRHATSRVAKLEMARFSSQHQGSAGVQSGGDTASMYTGTSSHAGDPSKRTCIYDLHREQLAHWGVFAGYSMPLWYKDSGSVAEHHHCRNSAALFDVSHMLQLQIHGKDVYRFLDTVTISDWSKRSIGAAKLSILMHKNGGCVDDLMITPVADSATENVVYTVVNAGTADKDVAYLREQVAELGMDVHIERLTDRGLLAVQGPKAAEIVGPLLPPDVDLASWPFMRGAIVPVGGFLCRVTRCGYTGEDGFEISVMNKDADALARKLLSHPACKLAGLGARDTLRLEAGLSLYGSDMDDSTTPVEAGMTFLLTKAKRQRNDWYGANACLEQLSAGPPRVRVAFSFPTSRRSPRHGMVVLDGATNKEIGTVTSGAPSPTLGYPIGCGYVLKEKAVPGTHVKVQLGKTEIDGEIRPFPLVPTRYYRIAK